MQSAVQLAPGALDGLITELRRQLGAANVITDRTECEFYSQDVYRGGELPAAVIRPGSAEELAAALKTIAPLGLPLVPRGGGMSYTDGYLPQTANSIMIDMLRMDRVLDINVEDAYVTVECGATWKGLFDALEPHGVRTPYYGPLSGLRSSIGGALSQGSIFLGSGQFGAAAESVIGLDVVLADGSVLRLGSHANKNGQPFFRQVGPDTMAMFLSDTGALGVKTRATFRLIRPQRESRYLSFSFDSAAKLFAAMAEVARADVVAEQFAFDPGLQAVRMKRVSLMEDAKSLGKVVKSTGGLKGLVEGAKVVMAGRNFLKEGTFSAHISLDGRDAVDADAKAAIVRGIMSRSGTEVENSVPKVMRAQPFAEVNSMLGPNGERWVPVHGTVPFSKAAQMWERCEAVFAKHAAAVEKFDIDHGYLSCTVGQVGTLLEPVMYWPDARNAFHERVLDAGYLAKLPKYPPNPEAAAAVARIREELATTFMESGAVSFQLGKFYPYLEGLEPTAAHLLKQLKQMLDPQGRMNPGALRL
ncbi:MAG: FAD-binding oxidoreductase [Sinobacteraceae bacterium]|nr:FAD-binding oxidoreductase [Nevskiaceae bacterium]MCP5360433.1 FAD-binding oxidoreductase [Nevskiaceae bacterium]MCP5472076.1 FAD-binding oxidoreductase [Nevskiaceae bacterium]